MPRQTQDPRAPSASHDSRQVRILFWGFASILALGAATTLAVMACTYLLADKAGLLYAHPFTVSMAVKRIEVESGKLRLAMKDAVLSRSDAELGEALADSRRREDAIGAALATVRERYLGPPRDVERLTQALEAWRQTRARIVTLAAEGRLEEGARLTRGEGAQRFAEVEAAAGSVANFAGDKARFFLDQSGELAWDFIAMAGLSGLLLIGLGALIAERSLRTLKSAQGGLEKARGVIRDIINSMPSVVIGVDAGGRITHLNQEAERTLGHPGELLLGRTLAEAFPAYADLAGAVDQAVREGVPVSLEKRPCLSGGRPGFEDVLVYPLSSGADTGAVLRIDDVTRRVRLEEMAAQSAKMLSVGGLAAGMAHEINNPLGVILQSAQVLSLRLDPDSGRNRELAGACGLCMDSLRAYLDRREVPAFLEGIREAGARATRIVADMLEFSHMGDVARTPVDLSALLDKAVGLTGAASPFRKNLDFKRIIFEREYDPAGRQALCASAQIEQVMLNLLKNAVQALLPYRDGRPQPVVTVRVRPAGDMVGFEVEDNGPGMEDSVRARVFEPFFTTRQPGDGAGIGLSVCYFIVVHSHGGTIVVHSSPGQGSRFVVTLPCA